MAKIFYSMSGEGRGHATRVRTIVEQLRPDHEIALFAPGDAYELLAPLYAGTEVSVRRIPGLCFQYTENRSLDYFRTGTQGVRYLSRLANLVSMLEGILRWEWPDLVVTDFEPALPRAARRCGIPFLSVNHQHFLVVSDFSGLPWNLRRHAAFMGLVVRSYYTGQARTVVSSFYFPPIRAEYRDEVLQVGVLLRPEVLEARPRNDGHLLVYVRKFASVALLTALRETGLPVKVYGLGEKPADGNLEYRAIHGERFVEDLASCEALVSTAGNQLVGEALYLRKPVLAMPETNNHEQAINAHYLKESGGGEWLDLETVTAEDVEGFLSRLEDYRRAIIPERINGNPMTLRAIEEELGRTEPAFDPVRAEPLMGELLVS